MLQSLGKLADDGRGLGLPVMARIRYGNADHERMIYPHARPNIVESGEATGQKARPNQQDEREGHFGRYQRVAKTAVSPAGRRIARALFQTIGQVGARRLQCREESGSDADHQRNAERKEKNERVKWDRTGRQHRIRIGCMGDDGVGNDARQKQAAASAQQGQQNTLGK